MSQIMQKKYLYQKNYSLSIWNSTWTGNLLSSFSKFDIPNLRIHDTEFKESAVKVGENYIIVSSRQKKLKG